jgi:hypothetical protein
MWKAQPPQDMKHVGDMTRTRSLELVVTMYLPIPSCLQISQPCRIISILALTFIPETYGVMVGDMVPVFNGTIDACIK